MLSVPIATSVQMEKRRRYGSTTPVGKLRRSPLVRSGKGIPEMGEVGRRMRSKQEAALPHWLEMSIEEQRAALLQLGEPDYRVKQIARWIFQRQVLDFRQMTDLPQSLREHLAARYRLRTLELRYQQEAADGTQKFLFQLSDGEQIETVLIPAEFRSGGEARRRTLCVSTQAGCPLQCQFCATGTLRLRRNLSAAEILEQFLQVQQRIGKRITNLVFMGMGEPLLNYGALVRSLHALLHPWFPLLGARRITVSTAGIVPRILALAEEPFRVKLAISLHATTDRLRTQLMPINKKWKLAQVLQAAEQYYRRTRVPVTFEYILFDRLNDFREDARRLARFTRRFPSKVNLIPFHPIDFVQPSGFAAQLRPSPPERFEQFVQWLRSENVVVMVRSSSGKEIRAACGQLALSVVDTAVAVNSPRAGAAVLER